MIFPIVRTFVRRPQSTVAALTANRVAFTPTNLERVARSYSTLLQCRNTHIGNNGSSSTSRSFATRPASRPKAHTGRTTSTPRKKALPAAGPATTKKATRTKKPKALPTASGQKRAKAKPALKSKAKPRPKPKPRTRKVLTEEEKAANKSKADLKKLKESALVLPKRLPETAWTLIFVEEISGKHGLTQSLVKEAAAKYRSLSPEELEHYNHIASQNKAQNDATLQAWLKSHSAEEIYKANVARDGLLQRHNKKRVSRIKDDRLVKRPQNTFSRFLKERHASGDFKGIKLSEATGLIAREFKGLTDSEKKKLQDAAAQDLSRYAKEVKSVYHRDMRSRSVAAHAA